MNLAGLENEFYRRQKSVVFEGCNNAIPTIVCIDKHPPSKAVAKKPNFFQMKKHRKSGYLPERSMKFDPACWVLNMKMSWIFTCGGRVAM